jgi:hypothetical protein
MVEFLAAAQTGLAPPFFDRQRTTALALIAPEGKLEG